MLRRIYFESVPQYFCHKIASYNKKVNVVVKRGSLLELMTYAKPKKKKNLVDFGSAVNDHKSKGVLNEIRSTSRRQEAISKLFAQNISDVLSTGDLSLKTVGSGIEITGVKVSIDYRLANVYWQIPPSVFHQADEIHSHLSEIAPLIRSELISRNVLGRVPQIFFVRDIVNLNIADFEAALAKADFGPNPDAPPSYEEVVTKNIYLFKSANKCSVEDKGTLEKKGEPNAPLDKPSAIKAAPEKPPDMKSNVYGLDYEDFMNKIKLSKKKLYETSEESAIVNPYSNDLFTQIPSIGFQGIEDRDKLLKDFCVNRKKLRDKERKTRKMLSDEIPDVDSPGFDEHDAKYDDRDYIEES